MSDQMGDMFRTEMMHTRLSMEAEEREKRSELAEPPGSVTLTYAELEAVLQHCRWRIESAPGEDPPDGYETLPPEQAEIADACWHRGMKQLSTALLNYWYDHGAAPVSPNSDYPTGKR